MADPVADRVGNSWLRWTWNWAWAAWTLATVARRSRFCARPVSISPCSLGSLNTVFHGVRATGVAATEAAG